jgi:hypothetical protein
LADYSGDAFSLTCLVVLFLARFSKEQNDNNVISG